MPKAIITITDVETQDENGQNHMTVRVDATFDPPDLPEQKFTDETVPGSLFMASAVMNVLAEMHTAKGNGNIEVPQNEENAENNCDSENCCGSETCAQ